MSPRIWRRLRVTGWLLAAAVALLNVLAWRHARAFTVWSDAGARTARPETLTWRQKLAILFTGPTLPRPANRRTPAALGLPFERHVFPSRDGVTLEAWWIPHPSPHGVVVAFHGYADCKASVLAQAQQFHDLGFAVLMVDFRGSGGSGGSETTIGALESQDVSAAFTYARGLSARRPIVLFGTSMGAAAVLKAVAEDGLEPAALVLECPFDRLLTTVGHRFAKMGVPSFPGAALLVFWGGVQRGFNGFRHNPEDYAERVAVPALVLHGSGDRDVTVDEASAVVRRLRGPKQIVVFPGLGHGGFADAQPERWRSAVASFLATAGLAVPAP